MKKIYCNICGKYKNLKSLKHYTFLKKPWVFPLFAVSVTRNISLFAVCVTIKIKKYLKKNNQLNILGALSR